MACFALCFACYKFTAPFFHSLVTDGFCFVSHSCTNLFLSFCVFTLTVNRIFNIHNTRISRHNHFILPCSPHSTFDRFASFFHFTRRVTHLFWCLCTKVTNLFPCFNLRVICCLAYSCIVFALQICVYLPRSKNMTSECKTQLSTGLSVLAHTRMKKSRRHLMSPKGQRLCFVLEYVTAEL